MEENAGTTHRRYCRVTRDDTMLACAVYVDVNGFIRRIYDNTELYSGDMGHGYSVRFKPDEHQQKDAHTLLERRCPELLEYIKNK